MVLSIGMIVKNEEKYLEQCLTALKPILNKVDSELIIADTGSTDNTIEIARKFTDNVYHFEWINDFAAARNSTLKKAQGQWYMFIDADEILQDSSNIIKFFKSGEYKRYNSATYVIRSYADLSDRETFSDIRSQRMVAITSRTEFVGKIHEALNEFRTPIKFLDIIADHYGYVFLDNGADTGRAKEKNQRNLEYLFEELKDENITKRNPNIYSEISDCYGIVKDEEKELEYLNLGLEKIDHKNIAIGQYYTHKILIFYRNDKFDEIIETANEYFDSNKHPWHNKELASDCFVFFARAYSHYKRQEYKNAISDITKFFDLYNKYTHNRLNTEDLMFDLFRVDYSMVMAGYDFFFRCCYHEKMFELADNYTEAVSLKDYFDNPSFMTNHLIIRLEVMDNVGYNKFDTLYKQLNDFWKNHLLTIVRPRIFKTEPQKRKPIIKKLASLGGKPSDIAQIYHGYFENHQVNFDLARSFLSKYGSENSEDILYILLENQMDISPFLMTDDFFADRAVQISINFFPNGVELYENYNIDNISQDSLVRATSLYGWIMRRVMEKNRNISRLFEAYGALGLKWYNTFGDSTALPGDIRAALLVNNVVSAKKTGNKNRFIDAVRELKGVVSDLVPLADAYKEENRDAFKEARVNSEFEQLAAQVKQNIRAMIEAEDFASAWELLAEFEAICPDDTDTELLKNEIADKI